MKNKVRGNHKLFSVFCALIMILVVFQVAVKIVAGQEIKTVIYVDYSWDIFDLDANSTAISNISGETDTWKVGGRIVVNDTGSLNLGNITLKFSPGCGISCTGTGFMAINNCVMTTTQIPPSSGDWLGITYANSTTNGLVCESTVEYADVGIFSASPRVQISDNEISYCRIGVDIQNIKAYPDFSLTLTAPTYRATMGEKLMLTALVENVGNAPAYNVPVKFYVGALESNHSVFSGNISSIGVGDEESISFLWDTLTLNGTYTIYATVDWNDTIEEIDKTNNLDQIIIDIDLLGLSNNNYNSTHPCIYVDTNNYYHIVWISERNGSYHISYKRNENGIWGGEFNVTGPFYTGRTIQNISFAGDGNHLAIAWEEKSYVPFSSDVIVADSTDGGISWNVPRKITPIGTINLKPSIEVNNERLFLTFETVADGIHLAVEDGIDITYYDFLYSSQPLFGVSSVSADGWDLYVVIAGNIGGESPQNIYRFYSSDNGTTFSTPVVTTYSNWGYSSDTDSIDLAVEGAPTTAPQTLYFQVQSPFSGYRNLNLDMMEPSVQTAMTIPMDDDNGGEGNYYQIDTLDGNWISPIYDDIQDLSGEWNFNIYGQMNNANAHGYLRAEVFRYSDNEGLFSTEDDEDIASSVGSYHEFTWAYNVHPGIVIPAGDQFYIRLWFHVTSVVGGPTVTTLTTSGTTQSGGPHDVWFCAVDSATSAEFNNPNIEGATAEFTDTYYTSASTSNDDSAGPSGNSGGGDEMFLRCNFTTDISASAITNIDLTYEGQWSAAGIATMYIYNAVAGTWTPIGTTMNYAATTDITMIRSITSGFANYISGSVIKWGVYGSGSSSTQSVDYLATTITANVPYATFTFGYDHVDVPSSVTFGIKHASPHLVWNDCHSEQYRINFRAYPDWSTNVYETWNSGAELYPEVSIDSESRAHVVWQKFINTENRWAIYYQNLMYGNWDGWFWDSSTPQTISRCPFNSQYPSLAVDLNDALHSVWQANINGTWQILYTSTGETQIWSSDSDVSISNQLLNEGDIVTISANVYNNGNITANNVLASFYVYSEPTLIGSVVIPQIPPHSSVTVTIPWVAKPGNHTIKVFFDYNNNSYDGYLASGNISVYVNYKPEAIVEIYQTVNIDFAVDGKSGNTVTMVIFEDGCEVYNVSITRTLGKPQKETGTFKKCLGKNYNIQFYYNAPKQGANPVFVTFDSGYKTATLLAVFSSINDFTYYDLSWRYDHTSFEDSGRQRGTAISTGSYSIDDILNYILAGNRILCFDASGSFDNDGQIVRYRWNFGDGDQSQNASLIHEFTGAGDYTVTLRIEDDSGAITINQYNLSLPMGGPAVLVSTNEFTTTSNQVASITLNYPASEKFLPITNSITSLINPIISSSDGIDIVITNVTDSTGHLLDGSKQVSGDVHEIHVTIENQGWHDVKQVLVQLNNSALNVTVEQSIMVPFISANGSYTAIFSHELFDLGLNEIRATVDGDFAFYETNETNNIVVAVVNVTGLIDGNIIQHCDIGVNCDGTSPAIANNVIAWNRIGINQVNSSSRIGFNRIAYNIESGLLCDLSTPMITRNIFAFEPKGIYGLRSAPQVIGNIFSNCTNGVVLENENLVTSTIRTFSDMLSNATFVFDESGEATANITIPIGATVTNACFEIERVDYAPQPLDCLVVYRGYVANSSSDIALNSSLRLDLPEVDNIISAWVVAGNVSMDGNQISPNETNMTIRTGIYEQKIEKDNTSASVFFDYAHFDFWNVTPPSYPPLEFNISTNVTGITGNFTSVAYIQNETETYSLTKISDTEYSLSAALKPMNTNISNPKFLVYLPGMAGFSSITAMILESKQNLTGNLTISPDEVLSGARDDWISLDMTAIPEIMEPWSLSDPTLTLMINLSYVPSGLSVDIDGDGKSDWSMTNVPVKTTLNETNSRLVTLLNNLIPSNGFGSVCVPLTFRSSSTWKMVLSNLSIAYKMTPILNGNIFINNTIGAYLYNTGIVTVDDNYFVGNTYGVYTNKCKGSSGTITSFADGTSERTVTIEKGYDANTAIALPPGVLVTNASFELSSVPYVPSANLSSIPYEYRGTLMANYDELVLNATAGIQKIPDWGVESITLTVNNVSIDGAAATLEEVNLTVEHDSQTFSFNQAHGTIFFNKYQINSSQAQIEFDITSTLENVAINLTIESVNSKSNDINWTATSDGYSANIPVISPPVNLTNPQLSVTCPNKNFADYQIKVIESAQRIQSEYVDESAKGSGIITLNLSRSFIIDKVWNEADFNTTIELILNYYLSGFSLDVGNDKRIEFELEDKFQGTYEINDESCNLVTILNVKLFQNNLKAMNVPIKISSKTPANVTISDLYLEYNTHPLVYKNYFSENGYAICDVNSDTYILGNEIYNSSETGIFCMNSKFNKQSEISNNFISNNRLGIWSQNSSENIINNQIINNEIGIFVSHILKNFHYNKVYENTISDNDIGIKIINSDVDICNNTLSSNSIGISSESNNCLSVLEPDLAKYDIFHISNANDAINLTSLATNLASIGVSYNQLSYITVPKFIVDSDTVEMKLVNETLTFDFPTSDPTIKHKCYVTTDSIIVCFSHDYSVPNNALFQDSTTYLSNRLATTDLLNDTIDTIFNYGNGIVKPGGQIFATTLFNTSGYILQSVTNDYGVDGSTSWTEFSIPSDNTVVQAWLRGTSTTVYPTSYTSYPSDTTTWPGNVNQSVLSYSQTTPLRITTRDTLSWNTFGGASLLIVTEGNSIPSETHSHPDQWGPDYVDEVYISPMYGILMSSAMHMNLENNSFSNDVNIKGFNISTNVFLNELSGENANIIFENTSAFLENNIIATSNGPDIIFNNHSNISIIDTKLNTDSLITNDNTSNINVYQHVKVKVLNEAGSPVQGCVVSINKSDDSELFNETTGVTGTTNTTLVHIIDSGLQTLPNIIQAKNSTSIYQSFIDIELSTTVYEHSLYVGIDSDHDGLTDGEEKFVYTTNSTNNDTDNDRLMDSVELGLVFPHTNQTDIAFFVADADPYTATNPLSEDTDGDGLIDSQEDVNRNGRVDDNETIPMDLDSDGDGIEDGTEMGWFLDTDNDGYINAMDTDSDNDGLFDGVEDANLNGKLDECEFSPINKDSNGDGVEDGNETELIDLQITNIDGAYGAGNYYAVVHGNRLPDNKIIPIKPNIILPELEGSQPCGPVTIESSTNISAMGIIQGSGTEFDPWVLNGYDINGTGSVQCIYIGNRTDYFVISNCILRNATGAEDVSYSGAGIILFNAPNVKIQYNTILSNNGDGIRATQSHVEISGNNIKENKGAGIKLYLSSGTVYSNTIIHNHRPHSYQPPEWQFTGIDMSYCTNVSISRNNISENQVNIFVSDSTNISIFGNVIRDGVMVSEIYPNIPPSRGIQSIASQMFVSANTIYDCSYGVDIRDAFLDTIVNDNKFLPWDWGTGRGVMLDNASVVLNENHFHDVNIGIYAIYGSDAIITNNSIYASSSGIHCIASSPTIQDNNILCSSEGLCLINSWFAMVTRNTISSTFGYAIYLESSYSNQIYQNNFGGDNILAYDDGINQWDDGYPNGGNYWSDYSGVDQYSGEDQDILGGDGIGDVTYVIDADSQDAYPLMEPYYQDLTISLGYVQNNIRIQVFDINDDLIGDFFVTTLGDETITLDNGEITVNLESRRFYYPLTMDDTDGDGMPDLREAIYLSTRAANFTTYDSDNDNVTNILDIDSDNDGLTDGYEASGATYFGTENVPDLNIYPTEENPPYLYKGSTSEYNAYFKTTSNSGACMAFITDGYVFTHKMISLKSDGTLISQNQNVTSGVVGNKIEYAEIYPHTNLYYEIQPTLLKSAYILSSNVPLSGDQSLSFEEIIDYDSNNLTVWAEGSIQVSDFETNEAIEFRFGTQSIVILDPTIAIDALGTIENCIYQVHMGINTLTLSTLISGEFMTNACYPITIDPIIKIVDTGIWPYNSSYVWHPDSWFTHDSRGSLAVAWSDVDQDGDDDLATASWYEDASKRIYIELHRSNSGIISTAESWTYSYYTSNEWMFQLYLCDEFMKWADVDSDGDEDLIVVDTYFGGTVWSTDIRFFENKFNEGGSLNLVTIRSLTGEYWDICFGDYNGDQFIDMAIAVHGGIRVFTNTGSGVVSSSYGTSYDWGIGGAAPYWAYSLDWGDIDNDGDLDLATDRGVHENTGTSLDMAEIWTNPTSTSSLPTTLALVDINNDGFLDYYAKSKIILSLNEPFVVNSYSVNHPSVFGRFIDVDDDTDYDIVSLDNDMMYYPNVDGAIAAIGSRISYSDMLRIDSGDYNGDFDTDLAVVNWDTKQFEIFNNQYSDMQNQIYPTNVSESNETITSITLTWNKNNPAVFDHYEIYYSVYENFSLSEEYRYLNISDIDENSIVVPDLEPNTKYYFAVFAVGTLGIPGIPGYVNGRTLMTEEQLPPNARAGLDQKIHVNSLGCLDGSASSDPDGDPITYRWRVTSAKGTDGKDMDVSTYDIFGPEKVIGSIYVKACGSITVELEVTDSDGYKSVDTLVLTVSGNSTSDPFDSDSDGDGVTDYEEVVIYGTDPSDKIADADSDGLLDYEEILGTYGYVSDPHNANSDWEGYNDFDEVKATYGYKTDPWEADTDSDYIYDMAEITGVLGYITSPLNPDYDNDGLIDGVEVGGWTAYWIPDTWYLEQAAIALNESRDPSQYFSSAEVSSSPLVTDSDNDGLNDYNEFLSRTKPKDANTDTDGYADGVDNDPTLVELLKPRIIIDDIHDGNYYVVTKDIVITFTATDPSGILEIKCTKDGGSIGYFFYGQSDRPTTVTKTVITTINMIDAFDGATTKIIVKDRFLNEDTLILKAPSIGEAIGSYITENIIAAMGPELGGMLLGIWQAIKETIMMIPDLIMHIGDMLAGGKQIAEQLQAGGSGILAILKSMWDGYDATARAMAPGAWQSDPAKMNIYLPLWAVGYVVTMVVMAIFGGNIASALVKGVQGAAVALKVGDAFNSFAGSVGRLATAAKSMSGVMGSTRAMLAAGMGTYLGATAVGAYFWPEVFGEWFKNGFACAFVMVSVAGTVDSVSMVKQRPGMFKAAQRDAVGEFAEDVAGTEVRKISNEVTEMSGTLRGTSIKIDGIYLDKSVWDDFKGYFDGKPVRGMKGEEVMAMYCGEGGLGWIRLDIPNHPNIPGIDGIYRKADGTIVFVEAKQTGVNGNYAVKLDTLTDGTTRQMDDNWISNHVGNIKDSAIRQELESALASNNYEKKLVIYRTGPATGKTITEGLAIDLLALRGNARSFDVVVIYKLP